jgi:hypothetical protein
MTGSTTGSGSATGVESADASDVLVVFACSVDCGGSSTNTGTAVDVVVDDVVVVDVVVVDSCVVVVC